MRLLVYMLPAFVLAAEATGSGLKQRLVTTLERHARQVSGDMFDDSQQKLQEGVSSLADWLARMFADMGETVSPHCRLS